MAIPRLPESASSIDITITVNTKLRPYFEVWYQKNKTEGETPQQFALRALKQAAFNAYLQIEAVTLPAEIEAAKNAVTENFKIDATALQTEVD